MFLCREKELEELERRYRDGKFECMIIFGRRRVGKTTLINKFCENKKNIYFPALKDTVQGNLRQLSAAIQACREPDGASLAVYSSFQDAFQEIGRMAKNERIVFVIDEYPYLARADASISSRLQHLIDLGWKNGKLFLILCGSSVSFMEGEVLSYESPLFGRRTGQIHLLPLDYWDSAQFCKGLDPVSKAEVYGVTGGVPLYIERLGAENGVGDALIRNFFQPNAYLFEEPDNLLRQELREPAVYNAIIKAVAGGATKLNEVASEAGLETASCTSYMRTLMELGILEKETPIGQKEGRKSLFRICDLFFRFWYRFVPANMGAILTGRIEEAYERSIGAKLHDYMGPVFETMCAQYLMYHMKEQTLLINRIGRFWGPDPKEKRTVEIDLIGEPAWDGGQAKEYVAASCKFRNKQPGIGELEQLKAYSRVFSADARFHYYIFSISGFQKELRDAQKRGECRLVTLEEMYE